MSTPRDESSPPGDGQPDKTDRGSGSGSSPRTVSRIRRTKITRPEIGSLYDIMHEHAGTSLYIVPICWTDLHSKRLGARFEELPAIEKPVPDHVPGRMLEPSKLARNITTELHVLFKRDGHPAQLANKNRAIKHVMSTFFPHTLSRPKTGTELDIYFGAKRFRKAVRIPCLWKTPSSVEGSFDSAPTIPNTSFLEPTESYDFTPNKPMLAYINRDQLSFIRRNLFRVVLGPNGTPNEPVSRLQRLRSNQLAPANSNHDPYMIAIFLAMAQAHFYRRNSPSSQSSASGSSQRAAPEPPSKFHEVKVQIITHDEGDTNTPNFIIYTAVVKPAFLERFLRPEKGSSVAEAAKKDNGIDITYASVSFWPILGLKERLAKALGREVAGEPLFADPDYIGLWDQLLDHPRSFYPSVPFKRRRSERIALPVVHNSSFEEGPSSDEDSPVLSPSAKRRRTGRVNPLEVC
jgi:hypothetical protein